MASKVCGTCKHLVLKYPNRNTGLPATEGYCYGVPPAPGKFYPKMNVGDRACGCHEEKEKKGE